MAISKSQLSDLDNAKNIFFTQKMFFASYLYKVEFTLPAARLMYEIHNMTFYEFSCFIHNKNSVYKTPERKSYCRRNADTSPADATQLYCINKLCQKDSNKIKLTIRGSKVRVYLQTVDDLESFVNCILELIDANSCVSIHRPENKEAEEKLKNNVIFVDHPKFGYKVVIHEGKYNLTAKARLYSYLTTVDPDNVHLTPHFDGMFKSNQPYLYGSFFVNDPSITLFATIIEPTFINKIYKLEEIRNK